MPKIKTQKEVKEEEQAQISDMLKNPPEPKNDDEEEIVEEVIEEEEVEKEEEELEEPEIEEEEEDEEEPEPQPQGSDKDEVIANLRATIDKLSGGSEQIARPASPQPEPKEEEGKEKQEQVQKKAEESGVDVENFVTPEEFEALQTDPKVFNNVMKRLYKAAEANARQEVMRDIPKLVQTTASRQATYMQAVNKFYDDNPDLKPFKKFVSVTMNEVAADKPDMSLDAMLVETAKRARKGLALAEQAQDTEQKRRSDEEDGNSKPAFARGSRGGRSSQASDNRSGQKKQIDDLLSIR